MHWNRQYVAVTAPRFQALKKGTLQYIRDGQALSHIADTKSACLRHIWWKGKQAFLPWFPLVTITRRTAEPTCYLPDLPELYNIFEEVISIFLHPGRWIFHIVLASYKEPERTRTLAHDKPYFFMQDRLLMSNIPKQRDGFILAWKICVKYEGYSFSIQSCFSV